MRVKICGITEPIQAMAIANLGATDLGFICVPSSPRYLNPEALKAIVEKLPSNLNKIGVFANTTIENIQQVVASSKLTGVQLHGEESPEFCLELKKILPRVELIKAIRIKNHEAIALVNTYEKVVDTLLVDAYHPQMLGGTGKTIDWGLLKDFCPKLPWFLAGGLTPENILEPLKSLKPCGVDLSSGVENSPGDKNLEKVSLLFDHLKNAHRQTS